MKNLIKTTVALFVALIFFTAQTTSESGYKPHKLKPKVDHVYVVPEFWETLGTCETGHIGEAGDGKPRFDWGAKRRNLEGSRYEGFVGFYYGTWKTWAEPLGLYTKYPHAYLASPEIQVKVASYGLQHHGYWGCLHDHPSWLQMKH